MILKSLVARTLYTFHTFFMLYKVKLASQYLDDALAYRLGDEKMLIVIYNFRSDDISEFIDCELLETGIKIYDTVDVVKCGAKIVSYDEYDCFELIIDNADYPITINTDLFVFEFTSKTGEQESFIFKVKNFLKVDKIDVTGVESSDGRSFDIKFDLADRKDVKRIRVSVTGYFKTGGYAFSDKSCVHEGGTEKSIKIENNCPRKCDEFRTFVTLTYENNDKKSYYSDIFKLEKE
jgi:hypothetical protein